jgi:hypothetical protein
MNTIDQIGQLLGLAMTPFTEVFDRADDDIAAFAANLGYILPSLPPSLKNLQAASRELASAVAKLEQQTVSVEETDGSVDSEDNQAVLEAIGEVVLKVTALLAILANLKNSLASELPGPFVTATNIANDFEPRLFDWLIWNALDDQAPFIRQILTLFGIVESTDFTEDVTQFRPEYSLKQVHWERIPAYFQNPGQVFADVYGWGTPDLKTDKLFEILVELSRHMLSPAEIGYPTDAYMDALSPGASSSNAEVEPYLRWQLFNLEILSVAALLYPTPKVNPADIQGLALTLVSDAEFNQTFQMNERFQLELKASINLALGLALVFSPGEALRVVNDALSGSTGTPVLTGQALVRFIFGSASKPLNILSLPGGSYLRADNLYIKTGAGILTGETFDALMEIGLEHGVVSINMSQSDGFLKNLLPGDGIKVDFDVGLGWTRLQGVYFIGSAALEIQIPTHISLGPINIEKLYLVGGIKDSKLPLEISSEINGSLGPLSASVERLGITLTFGFPGNGGNLGPLDLSASFKPPNGVGLALDAGVVKGGGYLYLDFDKGQYAGALELTISDFLSLKAIGLIDTKLPGGQTGFSLLIIITAEFDPGVQLGFGFTLIGVGGLLGLNRSMLLDPLAQGVRTGSVNSILFPVNVIENAPKIISDLRVIFPPQEGIFLIGPMAKIGWGTPTLISVALGIIIEIPGNVVILGRLLVALPDPDEAVLVLQLTFIGALEFDKRRIWFFASLYESRLLFISLDGEMGLLMDYSDNPNFVLSVGGFHPRFSPPPLPFPSPKRISLSIVNESWARIGAETYFAVTSNTVQMGVSAQAFFGFDSLSLEGYFSFDALLQFSPFYLIVQLSAGFSVKVFGVGVFGIRLEGSLEGPTPWHIHGSAEIDLLFFSISVDVDATFGEHQADTLPPIEVLPKLLAEFEKLESWRATLPASGLLFVSLRDLGSSGTLVLHPVGTLQISQRFAPLNLPLDKIGNQKPSDIKGATVSVTTGALAVKGSTRENFAVAQFRNMDDAAKLSAPSFEKLDSGVEIGASGQPWASGPGAQRNVRYEQIIIDTAFKRYQRHFFKFWDGLFTHFRAGAAVSRLSISQAAQKRMQPFDSKVTIADEQYTVAFQADNRAYTSTATFFSYAEAQAHMGSVLQQDPSLTDEIHVIPSAEVNQAS